MAIHEKSIPICSTSISHDILAYFPLPLPNTENWFLCAMERRWEKFVPLKGSVEIEQYAQTLHKETNSLYWVAEKGNMQGGHVIFKLNME
ncbi:hypothetical protein Tco_1251531 [Tanacetum coccineum]